MGSPEPPMLPQLMLDTVHMLLPPTPDIPVLDTSDMLVMLDSDTPVLLDTDTPVMLDILAMLVWDTLVLAILVPTTVKLGRHWYADDWVFPHIFIVTTNKYISAENG